MTNAAEPFTALLRSSAASFADARRAAEDKSSKPDQALAEYSLSACVVGLERIGLLVRRYSASSEFRSLARGEQLGALPIVTVAAFKQAAEAAAEGIESVRPQLGPAAERVAKTIRRWVESRSLEDVELLGTQVATAIRLLKRRDSRHV